MQTRPCHVVNGNDAVYFTGSNVCFVEKRKICVILFPFPTYNGLRLHQDKNQMECVENQDSAGDVVSTRTPEL